MRAILGTVRYWLPLVAGCACLIVATQVDAVVAWVLMIAAFGLVLDACTAMFERAGRTGSIYDNKQ
jgi:ABC-type nitrate/sulfonate/bicarbonate transport system permease component